YEHGVINTVDPLGGSYYVESLTQKMEDEAERYFEKIDALGGVIHAIEAGFFQKEIADAAYRYQMELDRKEKIIVGVSDFVEEDEKIDIPILKISKEVEVQQVKRLKELKASRNNEKVTETIDALVQAANDGSNLMPRILDCARNNVTLGEMCNALKEPFGVYEEQAVF
ncbi:MAG TPA: methylmalonyl-CoA mutase family protein, partial [Ignavibacteria bacterium]|nr:methylmalonyl-CoA mutase family protein [Ignavibacteria bacterium]